MNLLTLESEKFKDVKVKGYKFKIRYMTPKDENLIGRRRNELQGNVPVDSLTEKEFSLNQSVAMNDVCIEEMPPGFNENESSIEWLDREVLYGVAKEIQNHTNDLESKLKKNKPIEGVE